MRNIRSFLAFGIWHSALLLAAVPAARGITWADLPSAIQARLAPSGLSASTFDSRIAAIASDARTRVRQGDLEHLVHYVLQSAHFTRLPPIEPALSAKGFVEATRAGTMTRPFPPDVDARVAAFLKDVDAKDRDPRVAYFRALLADAAAGRDRRGVLAAEYARVMAFLYEKEVVLRGRPDAAPLLYQTRGLSTDTAVEAGYSVQAGLAVLHALEPSRRIRRVLIVGPGIDLGPRTGLLEAGPPESYQPWEVIDALIGLGLSTAGDLDVVGADITPRVVDHLRAARQSPPVLHLVSGLQETGTLTLAPDFRAYFSSLGRAIGAVAAAQAPAGHLAKTVTVSRGAAASLHAEPLDIVTERLTGAPFDLIIATNILPYFGDVELTLALSNIAAMLAP